MAGDGLAGSETVWPIRWGATPYTPIQQAILTDNPQLVKGGIEVLTPTLALARALAIMARIINPKFEIRNSKQIRNRKFGNEGIVWVIWL
jgi:hypothetical protein